MHLKMLFAKGRPFLSQPQCVNNTSDLRLWHGSVIASYFLWGAITYPCPKHQKQCSCSIIEVDVQ